MVFTVNNPKTVAVGESVSILRKFIKYFTPQQQLIFIFITTFWLDLLYS